MRHTIQITKALSDATRLRILLALEGRELCVCEIIALIGLAPSTISKHLALLKEAGLVSSRKLGRWVHFSQAGDEAPREIKLALAWADEMLKSDPQAMKDRRALKNLPKLQQACEEKPQC